MPQDLMVMDLMNVSNAWIFSSIIIMGKIKYVILSLKQLHAISCIIICISKATMILKIELLEEEGKRNKGYAIGSSTTYYHDSTGPSKGVSPPCCSSSI